MIHRLFPAGLLLLACTGAQSAPPSFEKTPPAERKPGTILVDEGGQEIYWPKPLVSAEEVYSGKLHKHPTPRRGYTDKDLITEGFAFDRLGPLPPPGQHPRLYITPTDLERIRENVAKGDKAPIHFQRLWKGMLEQGGMMKGGEPVEFQPAEFEGVGYPMVNNFLRQAIYAQVMNDDTLGRALAKKLYEASKRDHKVLDLFDAQPERDNMWVISDTRWMPDGHEFKKYGQWYWVVYPESYDYLWRWLTEEERESVRGVIARLQKDRYSHFMELPSNRQLINHASMAMLWMSYPLVIEGEPGHSPENQEFARKKFEEVLEYYISPDGTMYENVKGFLPWQVYLALARRDNGRMLQHPHVFNHMRRFLFTARNLQNDYINWTRPPIGVSPEQNEFARKFRDPRGGPESRSWQVATSGHPAAFISIMNWFYPGRPDFDFIQKSFSRTNNLDFYLDESLRTQLRDIEYPAIQLAFATDGILDAEGKPVDWNTTPVDFEKQTAYVDLERGIAELRSSWSPDALQLVQECRSDFYTGGHETPEFGNFNFAADGILWAPYFGAYQKAMHRNVVTIDGVNGDYPPVAGRFLGLNDTPAAAATVVDYATASQFTQESRNELILHPKLAVPFHHWMAPTYGWQRGRNWQRAFLPQHRWFDEYLASVDYSQWDGQNTGATWYKRILPQVDHAWRTLQLVKGEQPFLLVLDDVRLGDNEHNFRWNLNLNPDITLIQQPTADEMIFGRFDIPATRTGVGRTLAYKPAPPKGTQPGEPLLYVRVLNRDTTQELPTAGFESRDGKSMAVVPATAVDPAFKVLVFPYRAGQPLPAVDWSEDKTRLTLTVGKDEYRYKFGTAEGGRTVFTMHKNGELAQVVGGQPAKPLFADMPPVHQGSRYEREGPDLGPPPQEPDPAPIPVRVFTEETMVSFQPPGSGREIRYTTDGSQPGEASPLYTGPFRLDQSSTVKAVTLARLWPFAESPLSAVSEARFERETPQPAVTPESVAGGLVCRVYEIFQPEWDADGLVNPSVSTLPPLDDYTPILTAATPHFSLPPVQPQKPIEEVYKGFYRFNGFIKAEEPGVHTFDVSSCGPVKLAIGNRTLIEETGLYHQDWKNRYGQVALAAGWHPVELIVSDPVFWKKGREGDMPFSVSMSRNDSPWAGIAPALCAAPAADLQKYAANPFAPRDQQVASLRAVKPPAGVVRGLVRNTYPRTTLAPAGEGWLFSSKAGPAGLFDLAGVKPVETVLCDEEIEGSDYDGRVLEYTGWFVAPQDGIYEFSLDPAGNNELLLGDLLVVRNNVPGGPGEGRVNLEKGHHPITLRFGRSGGKVMVKEPASKDASLLTFADLVRPAKPAVVDDPRNFLVLDLPTKAYAKPEQTVKTPMGSYRLNVSGAKLVKDASMGEVLEFTGKDSGLRLHDWPCTGRFLAMAFSVKLPAGAPPKDFVMLAQGREGIQGMIGGGMLRLGFARFYPTNLTIRNEALAKGEWVRIAIQWGPRTKVFINGQPAGETFSAGDPMALQRPGNFAARTEQLQLFTGRDGSFLGQVKDIKVYNTILDDAELQALSQPKP